MRAVALGYQGFGNLGDEAILSGIEELLRDEAIDVVAIVGGPMPIESFPGARRIVSRRLLPGRGSLHALRHADVLLMAGGGLLHDHFPMTVPRYLSWVLAARLLGCRVVWVGVGIGPLRGRISRALAGLTLRLSKSVLVRDEGSEKLARAIRGRVDGVIPDPALQLTAPDASAAADDLAIVARPPIARSGDGDDQVRVLVQALAGCALAERPTRILTFAGDRDRAFATAIAEAVAQRGLPRPPVEELAPAPRAGLDRLARCGVVVTVRLHGMILAAVAGRPFVAIAYDAKVGGVADELDAADLVVEPRSLVVGTLQAAIERAIEPTTRRRVALRMAEIRQRRAATSVVISRAIRGEP